MFFAFLIVILGCSLYSLNIYLYSIVNSLYLHVYMYLVSLLISSKFNAEYFHQEHEVFPFYILSILDNFNIVQLSTLTANPHEA